MRFFFFFFLFSSFNIEGAAQDVSNVVQDSKQTKRCIDSSAYDNWSYVEDPKMSGNGKFMCYLERNGLKGDMTILKECIGTWKLVFSGVRNISFTADSKFAIFCSRDTLSIIKLGESVIERIPHIKSVKVPVNGNGHRIAFHRSLDKGLELRNLRSGIAENFDAINNYHFSDDGGTLILEKEESIQDIDSSSLILFNISSRESKKLWIGKGLVRLLFNKSASEVSFMVLNKQLNEREIWFYGRGTNKTIQLVNSNSIGIDSSLTLSDLSGISENGHIVYFTSIGSNRERKSLKEASSLVNIWSYTDRKLQSAQLKEVNSTPVYSFVVETNSGRVTQIDHEGDRISDQSKNLDVYLLQHISGNADESDNQWNDAAQNSFFVKSISKEGCSLLPYNGNSVIDLSPEGRFAVYFDEKLDDYFSYEVSSGISRNITSGINVSWFNYYREDLRLVPRGISGWLANDKGVFIYDKYDVWLFDPSGKNPPLNLTNGYGLKHNIVFSIGLSYPGIIPISNHDPIILNAVDLISKQNGYYQKKIGIKDDPELLHMGNYIYHLIENPYVENNGTYPVKAIKTKMFVVSRMDANSSPNYFFTSDFRSFTQQSYVYPEKEFNWYRTELHSWKKEDGSFLQGVLYKPENFDSSKKYPVIFYYYEKKSFSLNAYLKPERISGFCNMNIPTFVSNGYLVFTPDINFVIGDPMQGTFDAVISAANYLTKKSYVDGKRMGIGGCSFGGIQTNYLVTHTSLFAAAYSSCSMSDLVSAYNDVPSGERSLQTFFESGQGRMGSTLWRIPQMYIKNSPIFYADKVTTPLLLMHTTNDGICSFSQAIEFFTALRRLGKKVWLLEYTNGNHALVGKSADDFGIRLSQFFDHYLKGRPAPIWMTRGIPAKLKGIDNGYKLDYDMSTPGKGLLINGY